MVQNLAVGVGIVHLSNMTLQYILHIPNIRHNLISVSKLKKDRNCDVTFFPSHFEFQDLISGIRIGSAEER